MITETRVDKAVNRLMRHFGKHVMVRPPASTGEMAELEAFVGPLPRELIIFLATTNGVRVNVEWTEEERHLCCIHEILSELRAPAGPGVPPALVPVRGPADGQRDWLVLETGPLHGMVMRWEPGMPGEMLLASSFGHYFDAWAHYLIEFFDVNGKPNRLSRPPFDVQYIAKYDAEVLELAVRAPAREWLAELDLRAAAGADME
ncbi:hypothetical protein RAS1_37570 [Phycisphaerae bacterium RAS1]|nr:hypothetical protein RAS1_37570 [Phycisphaerae bacterium RAS1]